MGKLAKSDITQGLLHELFCYSEKDKGLTWRVSRSSRAVAGKLAGTPDRTGYLRVSNISVHHLVWYMHHGYWPSLLDHINRDRTDNRLCNLRELSHILNVLNTNPCNKHGRHKGVGWHKGDRKWRAHFRSKHLGNFDTYEAALEKYQTVREDYINQVEK